MDSSQLIDLNTARKPKKSYSPVVFCFCVPLPVISYLPFGKGKEKRDKMIGMYLYRRSPDEMLPEIFDCPPFSLFLT